MGKATKSDEFQTDEHLQTETVNVFTRDRLWELGVIAIQVA